MRTFFRNSNENRGNALAIENAKTIITEDLLII